MYLAIRDMLTQRGISLNTVVSITTDGAPSMTGKQKGAVTPMSGDNPDLSSRQCIIQQSALGSTLSEVSAEVVTSVIKLSQGILISSALPVSRIPDRS